MTNPLYLSDATGPLAEQLRHVLDTGEEHYSDWYRRGPTVGSPASRDQEPENRRRFEPLGLDPTTWPGRYAMVQLLVAHDALQTYVDLVAGDRGILFSDKAVLRVAIEAAGRGSWLVDSRISTEERMTRVVLERLHQMANNSSAVVDPDLAAELETRSEDLVASARAMDFAVERRRRGPWRINGTRRPSGTDAMASVLDRDDDDDSGLGLFAQRHLSSFVHGQPNVEGMIASFDDGRSGPLTTEQWVGQVHQTNLLTATGFIAFAHQVRALRQYLGRVDPGWSAHVEEFRRIARVQGLA